MPDVLTFCEIARFVRLPDGRRAARDADGWLWGTCARCGADNARLFYTRWGSTVEWMCLGCELERERT